MHRVFVAFAATLGAQLGGGVLQYDGVTLVPPAGWVHAEENGQLMLKPEYVVAGGWYLVSLSPEGELPETTTHAVVDRLWQATLRPGAPAADRSSESTIRTATGEVGLVSSGTVGSGGQREFVTIVVFGGAGRYRYLTAMAGSAATEAAYHPSFIQMVQELEFHPPQPAPIAASLAAGAMGSTPHYELLLTAGTGLSASPTGGIDFRSGTYLYVLFSDGSWRETAPGRGFQGYALADAKGSHPDEFGTWTRVGGVLHLQTPYRKETLYPQSDGTYLRKDPTAREATYFKVPTSNGLRLDGRYIKEGQSDDPGTVSITFRPDGTFSDNGAVRMIVPDETAVPYHDLSEVLAPGAGRYEIKANTLELQYADGRRKPILFALTPALAAQAKPAAIYLGKVWFRKM